MSKVKEVMTDLYKLSNLTYLEHLVAKVLRLDGINLCFVKDFSVDIKTGFMKLMMELHANNKLAKDVNNSLIVLILKNDWPQGLKDYFPISLIGYI